MFNVIVGVKKLCEIAHLPEFKTELAAGADLCACTLELIEVKAGVCVAVPTGIALEIPWGYEGQVRSRSGLAIKNSVFVLNSPGTIDSDYRGEVKVLIYNASPYTFFIENGMRVAQLVISPCLKVSYQEVKEISVTERGSGGFGSTGV